MLFGTKKKKIVVEVVDARPHQPVVQLSLDSGVLADEMVPGSRLNLDGRNFNLVEAVPSTRTAADAIGHIRLVVNPEMVDSQEEPKLQTVSTVCAYLPALSAGDSKLGQRAYQLAESDWRQAELVSRTLTDEIDETMAGVRDVLENHEADGEYDQTYSRSLLAQPLGLAQISYDELLQLFSEGREDFEGVAFAGHVDIVQGGFAFATGSLTQVYGVQSEGIVRVLGVGGVGTYEYDSPELQAMADFCADHDLCLIDWPSALKCDPENEEFFAFFDPPAESEEDDATALV